MNRKGIEIWLAILAIVFITLAYLFVTIIQSSIPKPGSFFGEGLGILGFSLMMLTELAYSFRKRSLSSRFGRISSWFELHVFTGLVGPFLVLLHTSWKFSGIAGVLTLLTVVIAISGFAGRYIYTTIPRTADGVILEKTEIERQQARIEAQLKEMLAGQPTLPAKLSRRIAGLPVTAQTTGPTARTQQVVVRPAGQSAVVNGQAKLRELEELVKQRETLRRQMNSLATMRRLLGLWHFFHIPIGLGMFVLAIIHIISAVYFASPLK